VSFDERVFTLLNAAWTSPVTDWWAALVRASEMWLVPALVAVTLMLWLGGPRARSAAIVGVITFVAGDALIVHPMKALVGRPRPVVTRTVRSVRLARVSPRVRALVMPLDVKVLGPSPDRDARESFPSGHTWNAFAVATVLALAWRRWGWTAYLAAAAVAYARVVAGLHWPSDVLSAAVLSVPCTIGLVYLVERAGRALAPRLGRWPRVQALPSLLRRAP
jgi:undecaprenyl-diphosphatase